MERIDNIYSQFCNEIKRIETFLHTTYAAYIITGNMLPQYSAQDINSAKKQIRSITDLNKMSYCAADRKVEGVELVCEWVPANEYAKRAQISIEEVENLAKSEKLGSILFEGGITYIIWPPAEQKNDLKDLPELGKKKYNVIFTQAALTEAHLSDPSMEISLALTNQTADSMPDFTNRATNYLHVMCFTSIWSAFEVFVKQLIYALIEIDPNSFFSTKKVSNKSISYVDVFQKSTAFTSIDDLKRHLISLVIAEQEDGHQSIHSLINLLKECYLRGMNPYDTWYVLDGERRQTSYSALVKVKDARNSLIHDGLKPHTADTTNITSTNEIDSRSYAEYVLIIRAISHNIISLLHKKHGSL